MADTILEVKNLKKYFKTARGTLHAVDDVSFTIERGKTLGIVGESGSGKSVTMKAVMGILPDNAERTAESIFLNERELKDLSDEECRKVRGKEMTMIFQDPMTALNPLKKIGSQIEEVIIRQRKCSKNEAKEKALEMLKKVGISNPEVRLGQYPHEFSGGMRQRVLIAMALACEPELLIADEPTTALDVTIQAQILDLLHELKDEFRTSIMLITHDMGVVAEMADHVMVMYAGNTVEYADTKTLYKEPLHPYTWGLLDSMPKLSSSTKEDLKTIPGTPPDLRLTGHCCNFYNRCPYATEICRQQVPPLKEVAPGHFVACHRQDGEHRLTRGEVNVTCKKM